MKKNIMILALCGLLSVPALAQVTQTLTDDTGTYTEQEYLRYQLELSGRVLEDISDLFAKFSQAEIEADAALEKVDLMSHQYEREVGVVTKEGEKLHALMKTLISQVESYLIFFKRTDRENPEINARIIEVKSEINMEMVRLHYIAE